MSTGAVADPKRCWQRTWSAEIMYKNILIATDGSDLSMSAVQSGVALAKAVGAKVTAVTVSVPFRWFGPALTADAQAAVREGTRHAAESAMGDASKAAQAAGIQ